MQGFKATPKVTWYRASAKNSVAGVQECHFDGFGIVLAILLALGVMLRTSPNSTCKLPCVPSSAGLVPTMAMSRPVPMGQILMMAGFTF